jgi:hypothetical protein
LVAWLVMEEVVVRTGLFFFFFGLRLLWQRQPA